MMIDGHWDDDVMFDTMKNKREMKNSILSSMAILLYTYTLTELGLMRSLSDRPYFIVGKRGIGKERGFRYLGTLHFVLILWGRYVVWDRGVGGRDRKDYKTFWNT